MIIIKFYFFFNDLLFIYYCFKFCKLLVDTRKSGYVSFSPFGSRISYLCLQLINVIAVNGRIMVLRVIGEFFAVIEICRIAIRAPGTRVGTGDGGDNMQMQLLRHEHTQLPSANARADIRRGYFTSITLTKKHSSPGIRRNKEWSNVWSIDMIDIQYVHISNRLK